jgi:hypothetical protein
MVYCISGYIGMAIALYIGMSNQTNTTKGENEMKYTYDLNENSCLILMADSNDIENIKEDMENAISEDSIISINEAEYGALEELIANSELEWTSSDETGDLTDAPMLCIRDENAKIIQRWAYMDYQVKSFLEDLLETGKAVFVS